MVLPYSSSSTPFRFLGRTEKIVNFSSSSCLVVGRRNISTSEIELQNSSVSLPSSPLLPLPQWYFRFFSPTENKILNFIKGKPEGLPEGISGLTCRGSLKGWLAFVHQSYKCISGVYLVNVLSSQVIPLPSAERYPLRIGYASKDPPYLHYLFSNTRSILDSFPIRSKGIEILHLMAANKIAMSSSPDEKNCTLMTIRDKYCDLAICTIGDSSWRCLYNHTEDAFLDIIFSEKRYMFYATSVHGDVHEWNVFSDPVGPTHRLVDLNFPHRQSSEPPEGAFACRRYLVESPEKDILLVERFQVTVAQDGSFKKEEEHRLPYRTVWFNVWKIDFR